MSPEGADLPGAARRWHRFALPAVAFVCAAAYIGRLQVLSPYLPQASGYFHARFARLLPSFGFGHDLGWVVANLWTHRFADLDFLYHALLVPFTRLPDLLVGIKVATIVLGAATVASFQVILSREGVRWPGAWTVLLACAGPAFVMSIASPGPDAVCVLLLLGCVHLALERSRVALAIVVIAFTLCGPVFYLPLVVAGGVVVASGRRAPDWRTPGVILGAVALGLLLHPWFPFNLRLLWLHNFGDTGLADVDRVLASRGATAGAILRAQAPLVGLAPFAAALLFTRPGSVGPRARVWLALWAAMLVLAAAGAPTLVYTVPLGLGAFAHWVTDRLASSWQGTAVGGAAMRRAAVWLGAAVAVVLAGWTYRDAAARFRFAPPLPDRVARYLAQHTAPDEPIFTCSTETATELFFLDPGNRYFGLVDPRWIYFEDPVRWRTGYELARGRLAGRTYDFLDPSVRFGYCASEFRDLRGIVDKDPRMELVLDTDQGYVFRVDRRHKSISLDDFMKLGPQSDPSH